MAENNEFYRLNLVLRMEDHITSQLSGINSRVHALEESFRRAKQAAEALGHSNVNMHFHFDTSRIETALNRIASRLDHIGHMTAHPTVIVNDQSTHTINNINHGLHNITSHPWNVTVGITDRITRQLSGIRDMIMSPMGMLGIGLGAGALVTSTIGTYKDFENQMKAVQAISGASGDEMEQLTAKAREMGATTAFSATEAGKAFEYMAMAGWKTQQMMDGIPGILSLAAASGEELGRTSDIVTDAMTAFHMAPEEASHFADVLAQTASNANTDVSVMGNTFQYLASTAGTLGYSIEDVSLAIGTVANAGIKGEKAGTGLLAMLNGMIKPSTEAAATMERLGLSITDAAGNVKPFGALLKDLRSSFAGLSKVEQAQAAASIAGVDGMKAMQIIANTSQEDFDKLAEAISHSSDEMEYNGVVYQGAAQKMAAVRLDSLDGDLKLLNSAWEDFQIGLLTGGGGDFLRGFVQSATEAIGEFGEILKSPEFQELDWGDQIIFLLDRAMEKLDGWASGSGGAQFGKVLTKLAEIGIKAFVTAFVGLLQGAFTALANGNLAGAAGLGLAASMMPGAGLVAQGVGSITRSIFYTPGEAAGGAGGEGGAGGAGRWNWGRIGSAAKWAGRIAAPIQAALDANRLYESDDKVKTGAEVAGGWAGMIAGAKLGAAGGGAIGAGFAGVGAAPGAAIGGLLGGVAGYFGGEKLGGSIVDSAREAMGDMKWVDDIKEQASAAADYISEVFAQAPDKISEFIDAAGEYLSGLPERAAYALGETVGTIITTLENLPEQASTFFSDLVEQASTYISELPGRVSEWFSETVTAATTYAAQTIDGTMEYFSQLPGQVGEKMSEMYNEVSNWASNIVSGIRQWFSQIPSIVSSFFDEAISSIKSKVQSVQASFNLGFSAGLGHADGGIFDQEHIARFAEGNKPEAVIPLDISKRSRGLSILEQVQHIFGIDGGAKGGGFAQTGMEQALSENAELFENAGGGAGLSPVIAMAAAGGGDFGGGSNNGSPSFNFSGINFSFGSDIDEEELAISIGRRFLAEIRQGQENRG